MNVGKRDNEMGYLLEQFLLQRFRINLFCIEGHCTNLPQCCVLFLKSHYPRKRLLLFAYLAPYYNIFTVKTSLLFPKRIRAAGQQTFLFFFVLICVCNIGQLCQILHESFSCLENLMCSESPIFLGIRNKR